MVDTKLEIYLKFLQIFDETTQEHKEKEHIMRNHASPGGNKIESENLGADECSDDSDSPHSHYVIRKRLLRFSDTLHKSFDYNSKTVKRFGNRNHPENG